MSGVDFNGELSKVRLVYKGRRINTKNKLVHLYSLQDDMQTGYYLKNKLGTYSIGSIVEVFDAGDYFKPPYIGVGRLNDVAMVASWGVEDTLSYCQHKAQQHWRKLEGESEYEILVKRLNDIIEHLPASQKKAFLFKLIADLNF